MAAKAQPPIDIILDRLPTLVEEDGKCRSAVYADIKNGLFPRGVRIGLRAVAWPRHERTQIKAARLAGKSDAEIRDLVKSLEAARKNILAEAA